MFYKISRTITLPNNWLAWVILIATFLLLFNAPIRELFRDWDVDPNYGHGFLIPVISLYLVWLKRREILNTWSKPAMKTGFAIMLVSAFLFIIGSAAAEWFISRVAMVSFLAGLVFCFGGKEIFRLLWFPVIFLFFMIPIPYIIYYKLTFPLQLLSSKAAFDTLLFLGVTGIREGNILHFPGYTMEVIEACSGLRSMMVLLALGAVVAYQTPIRRSLQFVLFLAAIPLAIFANIVRLVLTAFIGVFAGAEYAQGFLHEGSGVLIFICGLAGLLLVRLLLLAIWSKNMAG